ncbi:HAESA-like 1 [Wolffia australiana]
MRLLRALPFLLFVFQTVASVNQDGLFLLKFRAGLDDPLGALSDWKADDETPCNWSGVSCSAAGEVTAIEIVGQDLQGPFHPLLCRIPNLSFISLARNFINSTLPDAALTPCPALAHLDLSENLLVGPLPSSLAYLPLLRHLDLTGNNFSGAIPPSFGRFPNLENLSLVANLLSGTIPGFLGRVPSLRQLNLSYNPFTPGPIPPELGDLVSLRVLWLAGCNLIGSIPPSLGRLRSLLNFDVSRNDLEGAIPSSLAGLTRVVQIELYKNSLSGEIPEGLSKISSLRRIDASMNRLEGTIPSGFFDLPLLESFNFYENRLIGGLPDSVTRAGKLSEIRLFSNRLNGSLPAEFGIKSPLAVVDLSDNLFTGEIPRSLCEQGLLEELMLIDNNFSGAVPEALGSCRSLQRVRLGNNLLSGEVPRSLWGLPHVYLLDLAGNKFSGRIPPAIAGATNLSNLILSGNEFSGEIPTEIGTLASLYELSADGNRLTGSLPASFINLAELQKIDLERNSLSGEIPDGIQAWKRLTELNLAGNAFSGEIPPELGSLPLLNYLDLSNNSFKGRVPPELQNLKLNKFNLSNNLLSGDLPPFFENEAFKASFLGNPSLCGDLPGLCSSKGSSRKSQGYLWLLRSFFILAGFILLAGLGWFYYRYKKIGSAKDEGDKCRWTLTSFHKVGFSEHEILYCLDEDNVIGSGASGKVYRAVLSNGETVAVKKLWCNPQNSAAGDAFEAEIATLGKIRHKNIVKLWCCCAYKESRLLVYEYMPNGGLGELLHGPKAGSLSWPMRYKIAMDAAEGLSYLHHDCVPPIVHRDVKSSNILLDAEFGAKVADFGVAKAIEPLEKGVKSMSIIAGSCGYIAPEYAYTLRVNEKSDLYSFGVVLLELVTGKPPVDQDYGGKDLVRWVCGTLDTKGVGHVVDPKLDACFYDEILRVLNIALLCTSNLPMNRPSMRMVVKMLVEARPEQTRFADSLKDVKHNTGLYDGVKP